MSTINLHQTTKATPEQFLAGLTDFGPGRSQIFGRSGDDYLKVHSKGSAEADVTEGSGGIWERLHYDWSDPRRVVMQTTDSNTWGGASGHVYTLTRRPDGMTDVDAVVVRDGKTLKGRAIGLLLSLFGKRILGKDLERTAHAIERRSGLTCPRRRWTARWRGDDSIKRAPARERGWPDRRPLSRPACSRADST